MYAEWWTIFIRSRSRVEVGGAIQLDQRVPFLKHSKEDSIFHLSRGEALFLEALINCFHLLGKEISSGSFVTQIYSKIHPRCPMKRLPEKWVVSAVFSGNVEIWVVPNFIPWSFDESLRDQMCSEIRILACLLACVRTEEVLYFSSVPMF